MESELKETEKVVITDNVQQQAAAQSVAQPAAEPLQQEPFQPVANSVQQTVSQPVAPPPVQTAPVQQEPTQPGNPEDTGSMGWIFLGLFVNPLLGFAVYLCWKNYRPRTAKKALIGGILGIIWSIVLLVLINGFLLGILAPSPYPSYSNIYYY